VQQYNTIPAESGSMESGGLQCRVQPSTLDIDTYTTPYPISDPSEVLQSQGMVILRYLLHVHNTIIP
jgi:hypothetical protein